MTRHADAPLDEADAAAKAGTRALAYEAWLSGLQSKPHGHDLWQTLRRVEAMHPELPRLGEAQRPSDEPLRVRQPAELHFPPTAICGATSSAEGGPLLLDQRVFGLLGPNGPLPLHLTEFIRERRTHHADPTLQAFTDLLTQRFALLFYRAWAQAQPVLALDRPGISQLERWLGSLYGQGSDTTLRRDALPDAARQVFAGRLSRQVRDADGLHAWCRLQFDVPLQVRQWQGHWMPLDRSERTRLRRRDAQGLGRGAVLGKAVWDVQHKFRIVIGPLTLDRYQAFLPGGRELARLQAMVRQWVGLEFEWDVQLILAAREVPPLRLGQAGASTGTGALGRSAWLGRRRKAGDADDLVIDVERTLHARRRTHRTNTTRPAHGGVPS